jgi:hypothetical protein
VVRIFSNIVFYLKIHISRVSLEFEYIPLPVVSEKIQWCNGCGYNCTCRFCGFDGEGEINIAIRTSGFVDPGIQLHDKPAGPQNGKEFFLSVKRGLFAYLKRFQRSLNHIDPISAHSQ